MSTLPTHFGFTYASDSHCPPHLLRLRTELAQRAGSPKLPSLGPNEYEAKPDGEAFRKLNPRKAPDPGPLLLQRGDQLAIVGDSITEQRMYSRQVDSVRPSRRCWTKTPSYGCVDFFRTDRVGFRLGLV